KQIIDQFILKEMCDLIKIDPNSIKLANGVDDLIINQYTYEAGVRELKRAFEKIFLKLNIDRIYNTGIFKESGNFSKGKILKLTGNQKKVMRESVITAFTAAVHLIRPDIRNDYIKKNPHGLHIHCPSPSPKNGPSGGAAFSCGIISRILNLPIKNDIAMTGE